MKKINLLLLITGLSMTIHTTAQVKFGFKAGGNVSNLKFDIDSDYGNEPETKFRLGIHFGVIADFPILAEKLSIQPSLLFSSKGYSMDTENDLRRDVEADGFIFSDFEGYERLSLNYIEIPINFVYKINNFQLSAGPYLAFGIGGKYKHDFSFKVNGDNFDSNDLYDKDSYNLKPIYGEVDDEIFEDFLDDDDLFGLYRGIDYGVNFGVGYQVNSFLFNVAYSLGLNNATAKFDTDRYGIDEGYTENVVMKNRVITFSISYFLN